MNQPTATNTSAAPLLPILGQSRPRCARSNQGAHAPLAAPSLALLAAAGPGQATIRNRPAASAGPEVAASTVAILQVLAVAVISRGNTKKEMDRKLREYFTAGTRLVWYVYPETREIHVFTAPDQTRIVKEPELLDGGDVLPRFTLDLRELLGP